MLSSGSLDKKIINFDIRSKEAIISKIDLHQKEVCGLKWNSNGKYLASGGNDNMLYIWDFKNFNNIN